MTFLDLKLTKNEKKNIFFSHQIKGNAIISSNHKGQVIISNGFIFTAIFIFGILKSANQLAKYEYFSKMEKNLHMTHYKILFTSEAQNAKFCHFLKRFVTTSKLFSVPKHTKID